MAKRKKAPTIDRQAQLERQRKLEDLIERGWAELRAKRGSEPQTGQSR